MDSSLHPLTWPGYDLQRRLPDDVARRVVTGGHSVEPPPKPIGARLRSRRRLVSVFSHRANPALAAQKSFSTE
jgi:hypothetical protein